MSKMCPNNVQELSKILAIWRFEIFRLNIQKIIIMKKFKFNHSHLGDALSRNQLELILGGGSGVSSRKDLPNCPSLYGGSCTDKTKGASCWYFIYEGGSRKAIGKCDHMSSGTSVEKRCVNWTSSRVECK